jgi:Raf kinase inhibitor-like YbhB/YbcL family protein
MARLLGLSLLLTCILLASCGNHQGVPTLEEGSAKMKLTSSVFSEGASIPGKYTCDGEDRSPGLKWNGAPKETKTFALICDDPDAPAGTWVHWVAYDLPASTTELGEAIPPLNSVPGGGTQGNNDFGRIGYGGPCPPQGKAHRYYFKLYALDRALGLSAGASKQALIDAMKDHILGEAQLMGTYQRK